MPRFTDDLVTNFTGNYAYSAVKLDKLESDVYTLVVIALDVSGSVSNFKDILIEGLKRCIQSCSKSPYAESLLIRLITFNNVVTEIHGFQLLSNCQLSDYDNCCVPAGSTAAFQAGVDGLKSINSFGSELTKLDYNVNACFVMITDGDNNVHTADMLDVKKAMEKCITNESIISMVSVLVGVNANNPTMLSYLENFNNTVGFTEMIKIEEASENSFAKLFKFISKSITQQSSDLNNNTQSQPISFGSIT